MAVLLAATINATQNRVTLTEPLIAEPGDLFRIGNEVVEFGGYGRIAPELRLPDHSGKVVSFGRGVNGTTAATHTATAPVLRVADGLVSAVGAPDPFVTGGASTADAISVSPAVAGGSDVQAALEGLEAAGGDTRVAVALTAAQIRLLWTVPVLAIAAPGAGKVIWLKRGFWQYTFVSVAYAVSGAVPAFDGSVSGLMVEAGIGLDVTESRTQFQPLTSYTEAATHINKAVYIIADPNGIDPGSSGDGTLRITLDYEIFTLS